MDEINAVLTLVRELMESISTAPAIPDRTNNTAIKKGAAAPFSMP
ncbi:hypothetical protein ACAX43_08375 [Paraburkholderia sp. IW21]